MYVRGLNGDVRLHSGSAKVEMYRGQQAARGALTPQKGLS